MTNMVRCYQCAGQKKVQGIGWMEVECVACNGVGKVTPRESFVPRETVTDTAKIVEAASEKQVVSNVVSKAVVKGKK